MEGIRRSSCFGSDLLMEFSDVGRMFYDWGKDVESARKKVREEMRRNEKKLEEIRRKRKIQKGKTHQKISLIS